MSPSSFLSRLHAARCSAILRTKRADLVRPAMDAAIAGGFRVIEFTLTTPGALEAIRHYAAQPELSVGAGTVLDVASARAAVDAGATFLVSPVLSPAVIAAAQALGVAMMPGTHTPTEMWHAQQAGAPLQKVFPAIAGGPLGIAACLGPLPDLRLVPTHGVDETNVAAYGAAGVFAVGYVATLFRPEWMGEVPNCAAITARAETLLAATRAAPWAPLR